LYDLPVVEEEGVTVLAYRRLHQVLDRRRSEIVNDNASIPAIVLSINLFEVLKMAGIAGFFASSERRDDWIEATMFPDQKPSTVNCERPNTGLRLK